jgi:GntR family transcriptional regulator, transcriptional repressor for pyruvate dehydrogenase complex
VPSRHLQPIPRTDLTQEIVKRLVSLIADDGLKPGDRLPPERELITQLSVGRSSLREAIGILSALGVVRVAVGEGMFVGTGDISSIARPLTFGMLIGEQSRNDLIETRRLLEVELAGLAAERATEEEIAEIRAHLDTMRKSQLTDPKRYARADLAFHLTIAAASHNQLLFHLLDTLRHVVGAVIEKAVLYYDSNQMPQSFRVHVPIFEAICRRDVQAARRGMAAHLDRLEERLTTAISRTSTPRHTRDGAARGRERSKRQKAGVN